MKYPLAIMDYGIGGMGLVALIKEKYPEFPLLYFSDSGAIPYGKLNATELESRVNKVIEFLYQQGAAHVVVACHSASTVVTSNERLTSIRELTVTSISGDRQKSIGIIGGGRTIRARYYQKELKLHFKEVRQRIAQPLSIYIERGEVDSREIQNAMRAILNPIKHVDRLLLACTHYPAISESITEVMKSGCELIDPVEAIYQKVFPYLSQYATITGRDQFFTTGDPALMRQASERAFQVEVDQVFRMKL